MSEFKKERAQLPDGLIDFSLKIIKGEKPAEAVKANQELIDSVNPMQVITLVDVLVGMNLPMPELKSGINKLLNLFFVALDNYPDAVIEKDSFPDLLRRNNEEMDRRLKSMRPLIRKVNKNKHDPETKKDLLEGFHGLMVFENHYVIKENVLFPVLEKYWPDYKCLQVMWSFHDDIRRNLKQIISQLKKVELDLAKFNKLAGDLFFNMLAIKFREEKILFPVMMQSIPLREIKQMLTNSKDLQFPFIRPEFPGEDTIKPVEGPGGVLNLGTGMLTLEQIKMLFNHLPVDITFVDENNKVKYFSTPEKRIFPRSTGIIGRDVRNCHPPESVHVVEDIIEEFRAGKQDKATFWIKMGEVYVMIQYFAVRDEKNKYCGVVEVSQEISEIRQIKGERRLLEWKTEKF
ncbi:MAG: DUF438 domain-containing protein [Bacteroidales bacterium]|nr:DUF438 domain-containing protein [Bacteroidales bacterium]